MIADWNIQSPAEQCAGTGALFAENEVVTSALFWREGGYERRDYSAAGWPQEFPAEFGTFLSSWKSAYKMPVPPPPEALNKNDAEALLRRLMEARDPAQANACYILALMLERKRLIKELDRKEVEGAPVLIYEHLASGETWIIPNPSLKLAEMDQVQAEVAALLTGSL